MKPNLWHCSFLLVLFSAFLIGCGGSAEPKAATEGMTQSDFDEYEAALDAAAGGMEEEETADEE